MSLGMIRIAEDAPFEKHYRIGELAQMWGLGRETVRKLVKDDAGVVKIRMVRKKAHTIYGLPESAARRIHTRLLIPFKSEDCIGSVITDLPALRPA